MTGIIDVGGGMRCVYSGGVYDYLLDKGINIDYCLGVSAGSANLISYVCGQRGRVLEFYTNYAQRKEYMSFENMLRTGSYIGLDYIFSTLCNKSGENPLDYEHFKSSPVKYIAAATRARDGASVFFTEKDVSQDNYDILKASCALPVACRPYEINGELYYDGGVAEPIPIRKAFEDGCDKVILVLSKPRQDYTKPMGNTQLLHRILRKYPEVATLLQNMGNRCTEILKEAEEYEKEGKLIILEPKDCFGMKTLTRDKNAMMKMYKQGYSDAMALIP